MSKITRPQAEALLRLFSRNDPKPAHARNLTAWWRRYIAFRRTVVRASFDDCILVPWSGMWIGIEKDGYAHS